MEVGRNGQVEGLTVGMKRLFIIFLLVLCMRNANAIDNRALVFSAGLTAGLYFGLTRIFHAERNLKTGALACVVSNFLMLNNISTSDKDYVIKNKLTGAAIGSILVVPIVINF